jgi:hypothetical protein
MSIERKKEKVMKKQTKRNECKSELCSCDRGLDVWQQEFSGGATYKQTKEGLLSM